MEALHGKHAGSEVLGKADAAIHLLQRIQENSALVHCFNAADAVIVQQHIAADSFVIVVGGLVGSAVKGGLPGQLYQRVIGLLSVVGGLSKGHLRSVLAQHVQHPADSRGIVHIVARRDTGDPLPAGHLHRVEHISDRALVDLVFGQFYVGKSVGRQVGAGVIPVILRRAIIGDDELKIIGVLYQQRVQRVAQLHFIRVILCQNDRQRLCQNQFSFVLGGSIRPILPFQKSTAPR